MKLSHRKGMASTLLLIVGVLLSPVTLADDYKVLSGTHAVNEHRDASGVVRESKTIVRHIVINHCDLSLQRLTDENSDKIKLSFGKTAIIADSIVVKPAADGKCAVEATETTP